MTSCWLDQLRKTVWKGFIFFSLFFGERYKVSRMKAQIWQNTIKYLSFSPVTGVIQAWPQEKTSHLFHSAPQDLPANQRVLGSSGFLLNLDP
jgi:hypothetical protein